MVKRDVQIGGRYIAKVANRLTTVRITGSLSRGGWSAINEATSRQVTIKSAAKLRGPVEPKQAPVTNGNGERMMTPNQRDLIDKLLNEKVVAEKLVTRYHTAVIENRVTLDSASTFIKHMIACPRKDGQQSLPVGEPIVEAPVAAVIDWVKGVKDIAIADGEELAKEELNSDVVFGALDNILSEEVMDESDDDQMTEFIAAYLDGMLAGFTKHVESLKKELTAQD
jgi:hypothetical protein